MGIQTPETILGRIKAATARSQISVYRSERIGRLDASFTNTVNGRWDREKRQDLIGVFSRDSNMAAVEQKLYREASHGTEA